MSDSDGLDPDRPEKFGVGLWVQDRMGRWHRSVAFDGYDHDLSCCVSVRAGERVQEIERDLTTTPDTGRVCPDCRAYNDAERGEGAVGDE